MEDRPKLDEKIQIQVDGETRRRIDVLHSLRRELARRTRQPVPRLSPALRPFVRDMVEDAIRETEEQLAALRGDAPEESAA